MSALGDGGASYGGDGNSSIASQLMALRNAYDGPKCTTWECPGTSCEGCWHFLHWLTDTGNDRYAISKKRIRTALHYDNEAWQALRLKHGAISATVLRNREAAATAAMGENVGEEEELSLIHI